MTSQRVSDTESTERTLRLETGIGVDVSDQRRNNRFEALTVADGEVLADTANEVLADEPTVEVLREPKPQLVMQRVCEPVERRPFNFGEVVVTPAEVRLNGSKGFAVRPGKAERAALSGAVVDAAVAAGHPLANQARTRLAEAAEQQKRARAEKRQRREQTAVEFDVLEDP